MSAEAERIFRYLSSPLGPIGGDSRLQRWRRTIQLWFRCLASHLVYGSAARRVHLTRQVQIQTSLAGVDLVHAGHSALGHGRSLLSARNDVVDP